MPSTTLQIKILADATQAASTMDKAATKAGKFGGALSKATLPAVAVIAGLGAMGKAAADDARGQAILANTLAKTAGATQKQVAASEAWIAQTALATGVADDQLRPALGSLARATGDVGKAQGSMGVALDVAAATGKDVTTVAAAMAKGYAGNTGALGKLLPGLDKATLKSGDMTKIMAEMSKMTGGTAAAAADTAAGKMQRAAVAMDEVKETAGAALQPVLDKLGQMLGGIAKFAQENAGAMQAIVVVIGILAGAILVLNAVMKVARAATIAWTVVQAIFNGVMAINPFVLIIIGIIALIAIIVLAYKKSQTFRAIVAAAWTGIKTAIFAVWNFLKRTVFLPYILYFKLLVLVVKLAMAGIKVAWAGLKAALGAVWDWLKAHVFEPIKAAFKAASDKAGEVVDLIIKAWDGLKAGMKAVWDWIKSNVIDPLTDAFDAVFDVVQKVVDWVKKIKLPWPIQKAVDWITGKSAPAAAPPAPPTAPAVRGRGARAAPPATGSTGTGNAALAALTPESQVIVQVSDRKMAQLVDVSIRASATSAARNLTRRRTVTV